MNKPLHVERNGSGELHRIRGDGLFSLEVSESLEDVVYLVSGGRRFEIRAIANEDEAFLSIEETTEEYEASWKPPRGVGD